MKLTPEEIKEIYAQHGITTRVHGALADTINLATTRVLEVINERFKEYNDALLSLAMDVERLKGSSPRSGADNRARCYCGAYVIGGMCEVCGRH